MRTIQLMVKNYVVLLLKSFSLNNFVINFPRSLQNITTHDRHDKTVLCLNLSNMIVNLILRSVINNLAA